MLGSFAEISAAVRLPFVPQMRFFHLRKKAAHIVYPEKSIQYTQKSRKRPAKVPGKSPVHLHMSAGTLPMTDLPQQVFPQKSPIYRQKSSVFE